MNWPMLPVAGLCSLAIDCVNKTAPVVNFETDFKMIRTTNVKNGFIDYDTVKYVTEETFNKWTRRSSIMSRLYCRNRREDRYAEKCDFRLAPPPLAARTPLRGCDYCRLTRH
jgi:hypothetical protein